jgi:transcription antitermination factor NusG
MLMATTLRDMADKHNHQDTAPRCNHPVLFPWWYALLCEAGREFGAFSWIRRLDVIAYVPCFGVQRNTRGRRHRMGLRPMIPGMVFVPGEYQVRPRREELESYAHIYGCVTGANGAPARIAKSDIEIIRQIEGRLNLPAPVMAPIIIHVGDRVRFTDSLWAARWGIGRVFAVANGGRIGIEVNRLIGRAGKLYVPASEIEVLKAGDGA